MAKRKPAKQSKKNSQLTVIFWLVFAIVIISIFMLNLETIQKNFNLFWSRMTGVPGAEEEYLEMEEEPPPAVPPASTVVIEPPPVPPTTPPAEPQRTEPDRPPTQPSTTTPTRPLQPIAPPERPPAPPPAPVQTRERSIYFTHVGSDGQILHSRVTRRIPVSSSPMQDALNVLLSGPTSDEVGKGILNLIPQNTRILSAAVRGSTAYLNFSEDFLYNTFGVEGYVAQLRQIVWTVTEFQNVRDVQFLIEGRRLDYLGEGIWIGSPIGRQSF